MFYIDVNISTILQLKLTENTIGERQFVQKKIFKSLC